MNHLQAMRMFTRVVDLTSFSLAAKQLGMWAGAVTRSVSMLEAHLRMRLLNRSTRRLSLTEAGQTYVDGCRTIIQRLDTIEETLVRSTRHLSGTLRVAASTTYARFGLSNLLAAYRAAYPRIGFDVTTYDSPIELIEGACDVGFSGDRNLPNSSLVCRHLTAFKEAAVASPGYLSQNGPPVNPTARASSPAVNLRQLRTQLGILGSERRVSRADRQRAAHNQQRNGFVPQRWRTWGSRCYRYPW